MTAPKTDRPDSPTAFPAHAQWPNGQLETNYGMTLRDYFAAKAMLGYYASLPAGNPLPAQQVAMIAYGIADAMLAERSKP